VQIQFVALALLALPLILPLIQPVLLAGAKQAAQVDYIARGQTAEELVTGSNRDLIWERSVTFWQSDVPLEQRLPVLLALVAPESHPGKCR